MSVTNQASRQSDLRKLVVVGHSHIKALRRGYEALDGSPTDRTMEFFNLRSDEFEGHGKAGYKPKRSGQASVVGLDKEEVLQTIVGADADAAILCINGNQHNVFGLFRSTNVSHDRKARLLVENVRSLLSEWLAFLNGSLPDASMLLLPPPPIESNETLKTFRRFKDRSNDDLDIEPPDFRLHLWQQQCGTIRTVAKTHNFPVLELPQSVFNAGGYLADDCVGIDPTHCNTEYGRRVVELILDTFKETPFLPGKQTRTARDSTHEPSHPYSALPDHCYWKQSVSQIASHELDPITTVTFKIRRNDKVATAGSCFAQHISKRLRASGFNFFVTEKADENEQEAQTRGFYDFSARYGNVYTARQLLQLFDRAFGYFTPVDRVWPRKDGGFCDPFRPRIEREGYPTEEAVLKDAKRHLAAVRKMFKCLDVFVFTLGLTECWTSRLDEAVYPLAPGVAGGEYDPQQHAFVNFSVSEVTADLRKFLQKLAQVNPKARVILTVSPVPLVATAEDRHVLVSTTYSKSVLRVAADEIANSHDNVLYFPSYEIITGQHVGNAYFAEDRRSVTDEGVDRVMDIFMSRATVTDSKRDRHETVPASTAALLAQMEELATAACEEEMLTR